MEAFVSSSADSASCIIQRLSDRANRSPPDNTFTAGLKDCGWTIRPVSQRPKMLK
jgi:hypothetical protein